MEILGHRDSRLPAKRLCVGAVALLLIAGASGGIESCNPSEEEAVKGAIEGDIHSGVDVGTIDVQEIDGNSADATAFFDEHEFEVDLIKEAGKWTVEKCFSESGQEFSSQECPLNYLGISH